MFKVLTVIVFAAFTLSGCSREKTAEIEMHEFTGEWVPVISVHGYSDNEDAAHEVIRGLAKVSEADGHESREYRIRP